MLDFLLCMYPLCFIVAALGSSYGVTIGLLWVYYGVESVCLYRQTGRLYKILFSYSIFIKLSELNKQVLISRD